MDLGFLWEAVQRIVPGVPVTLQLAFLSVFLGLWLALALAIMRLSRILPLDWLARVYVFVFRGTPLLIQVFLIYYAAPQIPGIRSTWAWIYLREPYWCALLALTLNTAAYASEIIRGGLLSVPRGQVEAGRACGMSGLLLFRRVTAPIALRQALPGYANELILMVKATSLASVITLMEITGLAHKMISETFRAIEVFIVAGAIYLLLNFVITRLVAALEWRLSPHLRRVPHAPPSIDALR
ncbi:MAG: ABC transporter permease subunit [Alphaproteobacteria bacterium]|nr:ABC transporter permease subunit [Alphaproteobacteria bacterium]TAD88563.1 MAG: ABC transporter permease subunit [Alphaproteobacteria bacterium]